MTLKQKYSRVTLQLTPMKFSDSDEEIEHDGHVLFSRGKNLLGGTEAGGAKVNHVAEILSDLADHYGYRWFHHGNCWGAIDRKVILGGSFRVKYSGDVIKAGQGVGRHDARGLLSAHWETPHLGPQSLLVMHLLTQGRVPSDPNFNLNGLLLREVAKWGRKYGKGRGLAWYMGDQNIPDTKYDTFRGGPFTSFQDELNKHEGTGHGPIDVIASYNGDGRVEPVFIDSHPDREIRLHTDHYLTEGAAKVRWIN